MYFETSSPNDASHGFQDEVPKYHKPPTRRLIKDK